MSFDEKEFNGYMAIIAAVSAVIAGVTALFFFIAAAVETSIWALLGALFLCGAMGGAMMAAGHFSERVSPHFVKTGRGEHVLTLRQKRLLRRKRGEVVLEQALIEVEQERDNITHRAIEAANDPKKPPHPTQWTDGQQATPRLNPGKDGNWP